MVGERKNFGKLKTVMDPPDMIDIQRRSYSDFLQMDIRLNVAIEGGELQPEKEQTFSENVTKVMKIFKGEIVPTNQ